jgi:hypothetical protein
MSNRFSKGRLRLPGVTEMPEVDLTAKALREAAFKNQEKNLARFAAAGGDLAREQADLLRSITTPEYVVLTSMDVEDIAEFFKRIREVDKDAHAGVHTALRAYLSWYASYCAASGRRLEDPTADIIVFLQA